MKFEEAVQNFLEVIDIDLCAIDEKGVIIHDKYDEDNINDTLKFPIDFKSSDNLRVFRCNKSNKDFSVEIMNTKYPKKTFIKNGIDMLSWRKGCLPTIGEVDIFSSEIYYNGSYILFIDKSFEESHISYRKLNHEEYVDVYYGIGSETRRFEIEFSNNDKKIKKKISIHVPVKNENQLAVLLVEEDKEVVYKKEVKAEEIEDYLYSLVYRASNIIMGIQVGLQTLDGTIFNEVFGYYDVAKEFINILKKSIGSNAVINELFARYFDSDAFKISDTWIENLQNIALPHGDETGNMILGKKIRIEDPKND